MLVSDSVPAIYDTAILAHMTSQAGDWTDDLLCRLDPDSTRATGITRHLSAYCDLDTLHEKLARFQVRIVDVELNAEQVRLGNRPIGYRHLTNLRVMDRLLGNDTKHASRYRDS